RRYLPCYGSWWRASYDRITRPSSYLVSGSTARALSGKVVLITGCSSGIGEATALACAEAGARLGICARRREELELVADKCRLLGAPDVVATVADVSDPSDASQFLRSCERLGPPYALVNNAGSG